MSRPYDNRPPAEPLLPLCAGCDEEVDPARDLGDWADMRAPLEPLTPGGPWYHVGCAADIEREERRDGLAARGG